MHHQKILDGKLNTGDLEPLYPILHYHPDSLAQQFALMIPKFFGAHLTDSDKLRENLLYLLFTIEGSRVRQAIPSSLVFEVKLNEAFSSAEPYPFLSIRCGTEGMVIPKIKTASGYNWSWVRLKIPVEVQVAGITIS